MEDSLRRNPAVGSVKPKFKHLKLGNPNIECISKEKKILVTYVLSHELHGVIHNSSETEGAQVSVSRMDKEK